MFRLFYSFPPLHVSNHRLGHMYMYLASTVMITLRTIARSNTVCLREKRETSPSIAQNQSSYHNLSAVEYIDTVLRIQGGAARKLCAGETSFRPLRATATARIGVRRKTSQRGRFRARSGGYGAQHAPRNNRGVRFEPSVRHVVGGAAVSSGTTFK